MTQTNRIDHKTVNDLTETVLFDYNQQLAKLLNGECIFINSVIYPELCDRMYNLIQNLKTNINTNPKIDTNHLVVVLQTRGGQVEIVERLVDIMRINYNKVSFVIPNYAYSAGTVLALSGDNIYMNYYSVLGPIDPQIQSSTGKLVSGQGILTKFNELREIVNNAESSKDVRAEIMLLSKNVDLGELFLLEQSRLLGISLVMNWLPKYKFKDWDYTETRNKKVTLVMKRKRAKLIAERLGDPEMWHFHGRGITIERLEKEDVKLKIDNFGNNVDLENCIIQYHGLSTDFFKKLEIENYIHSQLGIF